MKYLKFLLKKTIKNQLLITIVSALYLGTQALYIVNCKQYHNYTYEAVLQKEYETRKLSMKDKKLESLEYYLNDPEFNDLNVLDYLYVQKAVEESEKKNYQNSYDAYINVLNDYQKANYSGDTALSIQYYEFLKEENLAPEPDTRIVNRSVSGIGFLMQCNEQIYPFLLPILSCVLLAWLYCSSFQKGIDKGRLLPLKQIKQDNQMIVLGMMLICSLFVMSQAIPFLMGTIIYGTGSLRYPYLCFIDHAPVYMYTGSVLFRVWLIALPLCLFTAVGMRVITRILRDGIISMITGSLLYAGLPFLLKRVFSAAGIIRFIPFTYYHSTAILAGKYEAIPNGIAIMLPAVTVLIISSLLIYLFCTFMAVLPMEKA